MARYFFQGTTKDGAGKVICDATISVYLAGSTTVASIYTSLTGTSAVNSTTSGSVISPAPGYWSFYTDAFDYDVEQTYKIVISKSGFNPQTYDNVKGEVVLGTYTISSAKTITTHIVIPKGVLYAKSGAGSMTFNGPFEAGLYQVFSGFSAVDVTFGVGSIREFNPEWWYSGSGSWHTAINAAFNAAVINANTFGTVVFSQLYAITTQVIAKANISIRGNGYGTGVSTTGAINAFSIPVSDPVKFGATIWSNFFISGTSDALTAIEAIGGTNKDLHARGYTFDNIRIENFNVGFDFRNVNYSSIRNCIVSKVWYGVKVRGFSFDIWIDNTILDGTGRTGAGNSRGIHVDYASGYIPDVNQRPEGTYIKNVKSYGFQIGIDYTAGVLGQITKCDISSSLYGILYTEKDGGLWIKDNYIIVLGADATYGINGATLSSDSDEPGVISGNTIGLFSAATPSYGIALLAGQNGVKIENNWIVGVKTYDIYVYINKNTIISKNTCTSVAPATYSIYVQQTDGPTIIKDNLVNLPIYHTPATLGSELEQSTLDCASVTKSTDGTGEDNLYSTVIRANTLQKIGSDTRGYRTIHVVAAGIKTNANGTKTIKLHFGASSVTVFPATNDVLGWTLDAYIIIQTIGGPTNGYLWTFNNNGTITRGGDSAAWIIDVTQDVTLKLTGECSNAADLIRQTFWLVERL